MQCSKCGEFGHNTRSKTHGERVLSEEEKKVIDKKNRVIRKKISVFKAKTVKRNVQLTDHDAHRDMISEVLLLRWYDRAGG